MGSQAQALRALLNGGQPFVAADVYSALTGRIVQHVGFKAAYMGGHACGAFHYAVPDIGVLSPVELIEQAGRIAQAMDIPLIADADTLGETVGEAFRFTRLFEQAGVAGYHVEDEVNPKHSTHLGGLLPIADMQRRIEACVKGRRDPAFVIIARCDELYTQAIAPGGGGGGSLEEAIRRGRAYAEAGADALTFPMASAEATAELVKAMSLPVAAMGPVHPDAAFTLSTGWGSMGAAALHLERSRQLFETGEVTAGPLEDKDVLTDEILYGDLVADWGRKTGRPVR